MYDSFFDELDKIAAVVDQEAGAKKPNWKRRAAIGGAVLGGAAVLGAGMKSKRFRSAMGGVKSKWDKVQATAKGHGSMPDLNKVKSKADAKKVYRDAAKRHHPDIGGDPEVMKRVNTEWENYANSPRYSKLAMVYLSRMTGAQPR